MTTIDIATAADTFQGAASDREKGIIESSLEAYKVLLAGFAQDPDAATDPEMIDTLIRMRFFANRLDVALQADPEYDPAQAMENNAEHQAQITDLLGKAFAENAEMATAAVSVSNHVEQATAPTEESPDWAVHLDILEAMIRMNPDALTEDQIAAIQALADEPEFVEGLYPFGKQLNSRRARAQSFLTHTGLRAA